MSTPLETDAAPMAWFKGTQQKKVTGYLSLAVGDPFLLMETPITLSDIRPEVLGIEWVMGSVVPTMGGGYTTTVEVEAKENA